MPVLTPTWDTGALTRPSPVVLAPPGRALTEDMISQQLGDVGGNPVFVADIMSAALAHERCGRHLYRSVAGRTANPMLRSNYERFGDDTERHVEILETLITSLGGDPNYVSPAARATTATDTRILESTFLISGSTDPMVAEMTMLEAVLMAETIDHSNWQAMHALADALPGGDVRQEFSETVTSVLSEEEEHLGWAQETRMKMIQIQASTSVVTAAGAKVEEMVAAIGNWFRAD